MKVIKRWNQIQVAVLTALLSVLASGCETTPQTRQYSILGDPVDIAVNLGSKNYVDRVKLEDTLVLAGIPCNHRAMSLNASQIVVDRKDFARAKVLAARIIIQDRLTVRIYTSPDFDKSPATSLLEVWEKGQKVREETYKLY